jgi:hypothetical protein
MNYRENKIFNTTLITAFILTTFFFVGCGDSEITKGVTDAVKKSVEGEVAKTGQEIRKQFNQVINIGTGKDKKEDGQSDTSASKEKSEKDTGKESNKEND